MQHLEFARQVLWPGLDVQLACVSDQWAQLAVAGPRSIEVLERVADPSHDISGLAVPHLGVKQITVGGGIAARLFRISYSGERAYEIAVPARFGDALVRRLMEVGAPLGITPYGLEAMNVLRIEKGHVAANEINGTTTARDLGLGGLMSSRKDFIGRAMAEREGLSAPDRWAIAGFRPVDLAARLRAGAHFIPLGAAPGAANDQGYMTSVAFSPSLGHWIGLGLITRGRERRGERVRAYDPVRNGDIEVEITSPVFVDPDGGRMKA
jgi:sarcosine oxidase subunit alpha